MSFPPYDKSTGYLAPFLPPLKPAVPHRYAAIGLHRFFALFLLSAPPRTFISYFFTLRNFFEFFSYLALEDGVFQGRNPLTSGGTQADPIEKVPGPPNRSWTH